MSTKKAKSTKVTKKNLLGLLKKQPFEDYGDDGIKIKSLVNQLDDIKHKQFLDTLFKSVGNKDGVTIDNYAANLIENVSDLENTINPSAPKGNIANEAEVGESASRAATLAENVHAYALRDKECCRAGILSVFGKEQSNDKNCTYYLRQCKRKVMKSEDNCECKHESYQGGQKLVPEDNMYCSQHACCPPMFTYRDNTPVATANPTADINFCVIDEESNGPEIIPDDEFDSALHKLFKRNTSYLQKRAKETNRSKKKENIQFKQHVLEAVKVQLSRMHEEEYQSASEHTETDTDNELCVNNGDGEKFSSV